MKKILSLDGGGIRGLASALFLAEIERRINKPICSYFDLIAGCSAGAITIAALCLPDYPYKADDIADFFIRYGKDIFHRSWWQTVKSGFNFFHAKYSPTVIESVYKDFYANNRLKDLEKDILIPAYELRRGLPWMIKSHNSKENFLLRDVVRGATAASTLFPAKLIIGEQTYLFIDGCLIANNPAACAYAEHLKLYPNEQVMILSIGTGRPGKHENKLIKADWGYFRWIAPILETVVDSTTDVVDYQMHQNLGKDYLRVQFNIPDCSVDNTSDTFINLICNRVQEYIDKNELLIDRIIGMLKC